MLYAKPYREHLKCIISKSTQQYLEGVMMLVSLFQMREMRIRANEWLGQGLRPVRVRARNATQGTQLQSYALSHCTTLLTRKIGTSDHPKRREMMTEGSRQELRDDRGEHRLQQTLEMMLWGIPALLPQKCHVFNNKKKMQDKRKTITSIQWQCIGRKHEKFNSFISFNYSDEFHKYVTTSGMFLFLISKSLQ